MCFKKEVEEDCDHTSSCKIIKQNAFKSRWRFEIEK